MKKAKLAAVIAVLLLAVLALSACNIGEIIGDIFRRSVVDYEFTEDGFEEIGKFYEGFYTRDTDYTITWMGKGEGDDIATIKWSRIKVDEILQYSIFYSNSAVSYRLLKLSEEEVYSIDEKNKTYSEGITQELSFIESAVEICAVKLTNEDETPIWVFSKSTDNVTVTDLDEAEYETMQYEYVSANEGSSDKLKINFDKKSFLGIIPIIRKIEYQFDNDTTTIYVKDLPKGSPDPADFYAPTEETGYTLED